MRPSSNFSAIVVYSVISAAFIGPGTITTAVTAGSAYGLQLLWCVTLSTVGCLVLQEASARVVIGSGLSLPQAIEKAFGRKGKPWLALTGFSVIAGCAAYEAGNILGAVSGLNILTGVDLPWLTAAVSVLAFILLYVNRRSVISGMMTVLVALMGITFLTLAFRQPYTPAEVLQAATLPQFPQGSALLVLGLVGTTIVPYNIFLGSGISTGKTLAQMRLGLTVSVIAGGLITAAIVVAGTSMQAFTSFPQLAHLLEQQAGPAGKLALGMGLFAAGFSSSVTAPYAAAMVAHTVFGVHKTNKLRGVWGAVLGVGFFFGMSGIKPIPVILTVQALNGLILPLLAAWMVLLVNHGKIMPAIHQPGRFYNAVLLLVFASIMMVGLNQVEKALVSAGWLVAGSPAVLAAISLVAAGMLGFFIRRYSA
jgi:Mn2+/Fe2+ NRAMP family transporter